MKVATEPEPVVFESSRLCNSLCWCGSWCDSWCDPESTRAPLRWKFDSVINAAGRSYIKLKADGVEHDRGEPCHHNMGKNTRRDVAGSVDLGTERRADGDWIKSKKYAKIC